jgi:hypothetical protein
MVRSRFTQVVIADAELAKAIDGRAHWRAEGDDVAVYQPPDAEDFVRVRRVAQPVQRERYVMSVIHGGRAARVLPVGTAAEAVIL